MWVTASVQSFFISQLAIGFSFLVFDLAGGLPSGRGEQCGLGGHSFFCALLLDLGEVGQDNLCRDRNAVPVPERAAGVEAAVGLQLNPGQLVKTRSNLGVKMRPGETWFTMIPSFPTPSSESPMRLRAANVIQLPLQLLDRTRNGCCAFVVQYQPTSATD
jgi:hypothetical protein